jgi:hypothetical protein
MRKLTILVEAFALAAIIVTAITINPQWTQTMAVAVQAAEPPQESAMGKIIAFAQAAGTVAVLTIHPQSAKPWSQMILSVVLKDVCCQGPAHCIDPSYFTGVSVTDAIGSWPHPKSSSSCQVTRVPEDVLRGN